jgi:zinc protease
MIRACNVGAVVLSGVLAVVTTATAQTAAGPPPATPRPAPPATPRAAPTAAARPAPLTVPFTQFTLPNGLHVILHEDHTVPLATVNVWYHVGSAREKPGRTGFAHLFEHLMFEGSAHVKEGEFDNLLEAAGATNNGSTETDRTNYFIDVPSNALDLALFLESDRMGFLIESMSPERVNGQRDVVKNERRQSYENAPYGMASIEMDKLLYPEGHPYRWPTIGYMEDLTAASYEDVVEFFRKYYQPANASLVIGGDIEPAKTRAMVEKWFSDVKPGSGVIPPIDYPHAQLTEVKRKTIDDRVQLPRLYIAWLTPPFYYPGDAELDIVSQILAGGKNSRLYKRLVYDMQIGAAAGYGRDPGGAPRSHPHSGRRGNRDAEEDAPLGARVRARDQPGRGVLLQPDGKRRQFQWEREPAERVLLRHGQSRLLQRGSVSLSRAHRG